MPRTTALAVAALLLLATAARAQAPAPKPPGAKPSPEKAGAPTDADEELRVRRATALFLLTGLADEAAKYDDVSLRARVQARVADALWPTERDRALTLFRKAWDSAAVAREEQLRRQQEMIRRAREEGGATVFNEPDVREEVLRLVVQRDRTLANEFLAKLLAAREREAERAEDAGQAPADPYADPLTSPPEAVVQVLRVAEGLLRSKDVEHAVQIAEPALATVTTAGIDFLSTLRAVDAASADAIYRRMLARAAADAATDANVVSVLGSYVYTPHFYIVGERDGGASTSSHGERSAAGPMPADLKTAYLQAAAQVFLRPLPPEAIDRTRPGRDGTYFIIARMLPLFQRDAEYLVEQLRARMAALAVGDLDRFDPEKNRGMTAGFDDSSSAADVFGPANLDEAIEAAEKAQRGEERDQAYTTAALAADQRRDPRARELADAVDDPDLRHRVREFVDFMALRRALDDKKDAEETVRLARSGELRQVQRAWALAGAAKLLAKGDHAKGLETIDEALDAARHIDLDDADRPRALFAVASALLDVEPSRVDEVTNEAITAANRTPEFTGADATLTIVLQTKTSSMAFADSVDDFDVDKVFAYLARKDAGAAALVAKGFKGEKPRATALLVVGRTALDAAKEPRARNRER
jgi:hypothetical protein